MPLLHNPHAQDLFSAAIGDIVKAGEKVEITAAQAAKVADSGIWKVIDDTEADAVKAVDEVKDETEKVIDEVEQKAAPAKKTAAKRGSTVTETAAAPVMETR